MLVGFVVLRLPLSPDTAGGEAAESTRLNDRPAPGIGRPSTTESAASTNTSPLKVASSAGRGDGEVGGISWPASDSTSRRVPGDDVTGLRSEVHLAG